MGAVVSDGPMPQLNATLRNLPLSPDVTATETACMLMTLYCLTISMHVALFSVLFAVVYIQYAHIGQINLAKTES